jgi:hypothetical protein
MNINRASLFPLIGRERGFLLLKSKKVKKGIKIRDSIKIKDE